MDYRELLKAYMRHVCEEEGISFLHLEGDLTREELAELNNLYDEIPQEDV